MRALRALVVVILVVLLSPAAHAQSNQLQVLTIASPDAFENAKALTTALKRAVSRAEGWKLAPGEFSLEVLMAGFDCQDPPDAACLEKVAQSVDSDRFIWGSLVADGAEVKAHLRYWEGGRTVSETTLSYAANLTDPSDDTLIALAEKAFNDLLGVTEGKLVVLAGDVTGQVFVNGKPEGAITDGRAELLVRAGTVDVLVKAEGFRDAKGTVELRPGGAADLTLDMIPSEPTPRTRSERDRGPMSAQKAAGFGAIGVGSLVGVVGGVFWTLSATQKADLTYEEYRATVPVGEDPCETAKLDERADIIDHCDQNRTTRTMAWILTPTGVAIAAVGTVLVLTDQPKQRTSRLRVTPELISGPHGARVNLRVRF